jgi:hypothetical protein
VLGVHILNTSSGSQAYLFALTAVFGPGAGLAYAVCRDENHQQSAVARNKRA